MYTSNLSGELERVLRSAMRDGNSICSTFIVGLKYVHHNSGFSNEFFRR